MDMLKHAVLGLLDLEPMTGYDLKRNFDDSVNHFWSADQAQIYRTLAGLVEEGLAIVEVIPQEGRPSRKVHHITDAGRAELDVWLHAAPVPQPQRSEFLAKLFFASRLPEPDLASLLDARRDAVRAQQARLTALAAAEGPGATHAERLRLATLGNGLAHLQTELDWLENLERELGA